MLTVYSKPNCIQCEMTKIWLNQNKIPYDTVDVIEHPEALEEISSLGFKSMPVVTLDENFDNAWVGYNLDRLLELGVWIMERMSPEERMVLRLIPISDTRRINRVDISSITKLSERRVKKVIDTLVNRYGIVIIGERNGRTGYYIPETDEARKDGIKPMRSQAIKEFKRVSRILKGDLKAHEKYLEVSK